MEKLLSNGVRHQTVPESHIFPPGKRPGTVSAGKTIPVINLGGDHLEIVEQILKAGKEFGFFQVLNHGIPEQVTNEMIRIMEGFFEMPMEDKALFYSEDPRKSTRLVASGDYHPDGISYWRDCLKLACYPVEEFKHLWPEKPSKFRETLAKYSVEARELALRLLKLVSEGLGLEEDFFNGGLIGGRGVMNVNHYPPCPDPSLTIGLATHYDPQLITILLQGDISGLQVLHEGEWIGVEPLPNALVVNFGHQLEFITNGMLKSAEHRAVTNSTASRTSIAMFIMPTMDSLIAPAQSLINEHNPPIYRPFVFQEFLGVYVANVGDMETTLKSFMIEK